jgi:hypothetical protein
LDDVSVDADVAAAAANVDGAVNVAYISAVAVAVPL